MVAGRVVYVNIHYLLFLLIKYGSLNIKAVASVRKTAAAAFFANKQMRNTIIGIVICRIM